MTEIPQSEAVLKASHPIKIEMVEPILIKPTTRGYAFLIVRIRTNQGVDGIGECHASGEARSLAIRDFVDSIAGGLEGTNPFGDSGLSEPLFRARIRLGVVRGGQRH